MGIFDPLLFMGIWIGKCYRTLSRARADARDPTQPTSATVTRPGLAQIESARPKSCMPATTHQPAMAYQCSPRAYFSFEKYLCLSPSDAKAMSFLAKSFLIKKFYLPRTSSVSRTDCTIVFYLTRRTKLDPTLHMFWWYFTLVATYI